MKDIMKRFKKRYVYYFCFFIIFSIISFPMLLLHTPLFKRARKVYVGSAVMSTSHQWLATKFISNNKINNIVMEKIYEDKELKSNEDTVKISKTQDGTIDFLKINNARYNGYVMLVHNPKRVKVGYSDEGGKKGEEISAIIKNNNAIAGINGGGFMTNFDEEYTNTPLGIIMSEGKLIYPKAESEINLNDEMEICAINKDGILIVGDYSYEELVNLNVQEAVSFGPTLIKDGRAVDIRYNSIGGGGMSQRSVIGQRADGSIILIIIEGNLHPRAGATIAELQQLMLDLGAINAINLDGGNSVIMYKDGKVVNEPKGSQSSRNLSSGIIVK
ncbi:exopolysaccharide biosynthesis protein [Clostridium putrefaciens]|uniref:Exopolysaccharide biosynthesis protein n=1 Tax=Clostridium putrefaciens TaxID=99675 RepID=A0A381JDE5_9CLOT|nr:phosphodiester glycosidase family protein [Clostridium putrefaciens]SUY48446.1 exopolysaccharide biosynthesis protein [Clostridium putrefaciens]